MKKFALIVLLVLFAPFAHLFGAEGVASQDEGLRISLLTCSEGNEDVAAAFGHSAIRVVDPANKMDIVFNYGTYNFYEPGFLLKFLRGDLNYLLSVSDFKRFVGSYTKAGRGIVEREFNLTSEQRVKLYDFLLTNAKPENREYLYDFLLDNCATRIRDIFNTEEFVYEDSDTDLTYRDRLAELINPKPWLKFGTDLILGARVDAEITVQQEMFLPFLLERNLSQYKIAESGDGLLAAPEVILAKRDESRSVVGKIARLLITPLALFMVLLIGYSLTISLIKDKQRFHKVFSNCFYILLGIASLVLLFLWFGTNHIWTKANWNLLWLNPLFLVLPFLKAGRFKNVLINILILCVVVCLVGGVLIPQQFNIAFYPIFVLEIFLMLPAVMASKRNKYLKR